MYNEKDCVQADSTMESYLFFNRYYTCSDVTVSSSAQDDVRNIHYVKCFMYLKTF